MSFETCAPELLRDQALHDGRVDIWAFGCVVYGLAAGDYPFGPVRNLFELLRQYENIAQLPALSHESIQLVEQIGGDASEFINPILAHSLQMEPADRFESHALLELLHQQHELIPKQDASVRKKIKISIKTISGKRLHFEVERNEAIARIKELYSYKEGWPPDQLQLLYQVNMGVQRLKDEHTLEYYGIDNGSMLDATARFDYGSYYVDEKRSVELPAIVENEVDRLLDEHNHAKTIGGKEDHQQWMAATTNLLENAGFYIWNMYQSRKISRLTELHQELKQELEMREE